MVTGLTIIPFGTDVHLRGIHVMSSSYVVGGDPVDVSSIFQSLDCVHIARCYQGASPVTTIDPLYWYEIAESAAYNFAAGKFLIQAFTIPVSKVSNLLTEAPVATNLSATTVKLHMWGVPSAAALAGGLMS